MGFWNKLGKIALMAAPYVAAPFTGGASLALTGLANKGVAKWSEHDAKKRMAQGLAPSSFDRVLGKVGNYAGMASMFIPGGQLGALGKAGSIGARAAGYADKLSKFQRIMGGVSEFTGGSYNPRTSSGGGWGDLGGVGGTGNTGFAGGLGKNGRSSGGGSSGGWQDILSQVLNRRGGGDSGGYNGGWGGMSDQMNPDGSGGLAGGRGRGQRPSYGSSQEEGYGDISGFQRQMRNQLGPIMGRSDQSNPNLAYSIGAGRMDAIRNQPFRGGYDVVTQGPEPPDGQERQDIYSPMPPIYPNSQRRRNPYGNELGGGGDEDYGY